MFNCRISANGTSRRNAASDGYQRSIKMMLPGGCLVSTCREIQVRLSAKRSQTRNSRSRLGFLTSWLTRVIVSPLKGSLLLSQSRITFLLPALSAFVTASNSVVLPVPLGPSRETNSGRFIFHITIDIRFFLPGSFAGTAWRDDANRMEGSDEQTLMNTLIQFLPDGSQNPGFQPLMDIGHRPYVKEHILKTLPFVAENCVQAHSSFSEARCCNAFHQMTWRACV
ncbi:hypothetical protein D9M71_232540 [compost metagenome]